MKYLQLIFICEGDSDYLYLKNVFNFLGIDRHQYNVRFDTIKMNGKSKFNSNSIQKTIATKIKKFANNGNSIIVYAVDTDDINNSQQDLKLFNSILSYVSSKNYYFIYFNQDIEEVLNVEAKRRDKVKEARQYTEKKFLLIDKNSLKSNNHFIRKTSNLYNVFNQIFP